MAVRVSSAWKTNTNARSRPARNVGTEINPEVMTRVARSDRRPFTGKTITDPEKVHEKVREARRLGYALAVEEVLVGEIALAVAILGANGRPLGAIHIAGSLSEWTPSAFATRFAPLATEAAHGINRVR